MGVLYYQSHAFDTYQVAQAHSHLLPPVCTGILCCFNYVQNTRFCFGFRIMHQILETYSHQLMKFTAGLIIP